MKAKSWVAVRGIGEPIAGRRLPALDILRFLAAASVMIYHFTYGFAGPGAPALPLLQSITRHGYLGVDLFFMISGFVVLRSAQGRSGTQFARARILRLFPEFWISVLVSAAVFHLVPGAFTAPSAATVLANLTMVPQVFGAPMVDDVYWTLLVELKFYFLLWLLLLLHQLPRIENWLLGWVGLIAIGAHVELPAIIRSLSMLPHGVLFAAGGLFYLVFESGWTWKRTLGLAIALPTSSMLVVRDMRLFIDEEHITSAARLTTWVFMPAAFAFFATIRSNTLGAKHVLATSLAGKLTYPLYLLHNTGKAIFLKGAIAGPTPVLVLAAIAFSLALSYLVMRAGTGPIHRALRSIVDGAISRLPHRVRGASTTA